MVVAVVVVVESWCRELVMPRGCKLGYSRPVVSRAPSHLFPISGAKALPTISD